MVQISVSCFAIVFSPLFFSPIHFTYFSQIIVLEDNLDRVTPLSRNLKSSLWSMKQIAYSSAWHARSFPIWSCQLPLPSLSPAKQNCSRPLFQLLSLQNVFLCVSACLKCTDSLTTDANPCAFMKLKESLPCFPLPEPKASPTAPTTAHLSHAYFCICLTVSWLLLTCWEEFCSTLQGCSRWSKN